MSLELSAAKVLDLWRKSVWKMDANMMRETKARNSVIPAHPVVPYIKHYPYF